MKLSILSVLLGSIIMLLNLWGVVKPTSFMAATRKFPRSVPIGIVLILLATFWFIYNVKIESLADFKPLKPLLIYLFVAVGIGSCVFVHDFLAVRGLAVIFLLLAKTMLDLQRWAETDWRLVIAVMAYAMIIAGMWFTISPWRLRDFINWNTATVRRTRVICGIRICLGALVLALGLTVFP